MVKSEVILRVQENKNGYAMHVRYNVGSCIDLDASFFHSSAPTWLRKAILGGF